MITQVEALNYRCLKQIRQPLRPFQVLVGPNASGKSTFFDVLGFLKDLLSEDLEFAIGCRSRNYYDLLWKRQEGKFHLAVEAQIPDSLRIHEGKELPFDVVRYEIGIGNGHGLGIAFEEVSLARRQQEKGDVAQSPEDRSSPPIRTPEYHWAILNRDMSGKVAIVPEPQNEGIPFSVPLKIDGKKTALPYFLADASYEINNIPISFPIATYLANLLKEGIQTLALSPDALRAPSSPIRSSASQSDGGNLPWMVEELKSNSPERFSQWLDHLRTALPDLADIRTVEREEDRHRYLMIKHKGGLETPSWIVSEGTLRLLALTLPAYLSDFKGVLMVEEPENGIHPQALETMYDSLSSVYDGQVLLATHSPVILGIAKPSDILCFSKDEEGATVIIAGNEHPALSDWYGEVNLGVLFAGGVLG
ncbi:MAG: ATP-binding protein [Candidatus Sumerlaeota bacterium]|nr:ATP-binding protein [Candidatus Sumerlaeota bacterium]